MVHSQRQNMLLALDYGLRTIDYGFSLRHNILSIDAAIVLAVARLVDGIHAERADADRDVLAARLGHLQAHVAFADLVGAHLEGDLLVRLGVGQAGLVGVGAGQVGRAAKIGYSILEQLQSDGAAGRHGSKFHDEKRPLELRQVHAPRGLVRVVDRLGIDWSGYADFLS